MNILILYQLREKEANNFQEKLKNSKTQEKSIIEKKLEEINNEVNQYKTNFLKNYTDIFFSKIIKATSEIEIPETPLDSTGNLIKFRIPILQKTFLGQY